MTISGEEQRQDELRGGERLGVRVLFFGAAREAVGSAEVELELSAPADTRSALAAVLARFPVLEQRFGRSLLFAVNQEYAVPEAQVRAGDELAVFPPVSGGSAGQETDAGNESPDFFELTTEPIAVGAVARRVVPPECGATVTLDGYVRQWTRGRRTLYLVYEA
jgi:molybdopterin synthase catalytic subunit